jgi:hypothetical protein
MDVLAVWACLNHTKWMVSNSFNGKVFSDLDSLESDCPQHESFFSISDCLLKIVFNANTNEPSVAAGSTRVPM